MRVRALAAALPLALLGLFCGTAAAATLYVPIYGTSPDQVLGVESGSEGELTQLPGSPFPVVEGPAPPVSGIFGMAFAPDGSRGATGYLFDGGVSGLSVAPDGTLAPAGSPIETTSVTNIAVSPDGRFAYTPTREFKGEPAEGIRGYSIGADGSLTPLPISFGMDQSYEIAMTPDGRFLYQQVAGGVKRYVVNSDGTLAPLGTSSIKSAKTLGVSPDGRFLFVGFVGETSDGVASFSIGQDGSLTQNGPAALSGDNSVDYFAVAPDGRHLYIPDSNLDGIVTAAVAADGSLSVIDTMPVDQAQAVAVSADKRFLYYAANGGPGVVGVAAIGADGVPELLPSTVPWNVSDEPERVVLRPAPAPRASFTLSTAAPGRPSTFTAETGTGAVRYDWDFGDGSTLVDGGPAAAHAYAGPGTYQVTLTVFDRNGCSATRVYTGQSTICPGGAVATMTRPLDTLPVIGSLSLTRKAFAPRARRRARSRSGASRKKGKGGTTFVYRLNEPARVRLTIERRVPGPRCRPRGPKRAPRCIRYRKQGVLAGRGKAGRNRRAFSGVLRGRTLKPGRYRATAVAVDSAGGRSASRRARFRVLGAR